jgi:antitoxin CptB
MNQLAKLRWQCRRGTKELDLLLQRYLETGYPVADAKEKVLFVELLALEDGKLLESLMGELEVEAEELMILVEKIMAFEVVRT